MKILEETMSQMPSSFTSNEFNKMAVKNGYPRRLLKNKGLASFIKTYAENAYSGSKTWIKKKHNKLEIIIPSEEDAISLLKSKGYKIMKPMYEWIEC